MAVETLQPPTEFTEREGFGERLAEAPYDRTQIECILPYDDPGVVYIDGISRVWHVGALGHRMVTGSDCRGHFGTLPAHLLIEMLWQTAACAILSYSAFEGRIAQVCGQGRYDSLSLRVQIGQRICFRAEVIGKTKRNGRRGAATGQAWIEGFEGEIFTITFEYLLVASDRRERRARRDITIERR